MTGESSRKRTMILHSVRALLLGSEDGLTASEMARPLSVTTGYVHGILTTEYGFYVDRWATTEHGSDAQVWMCVPVPANCPRPDAPAKEVDA